MEGAAPVCVPVRDAALAAGRAPGAGLGARGRAPGGVEALEPVEASSSVSASSAAVSTDVRRLAGMPVLREGPDGWMCTSCAPQWSMWVGLVSVAEP